MIVATCASGSDCELKWIVSGDGTERYLKMTLSSRQIEALRYFAEKHDRAGQSYMVNPAVILDLIGMCMPDMTTTAAAEYLASHGYTVRSKRDGTDKPPNSTTVKQWCERGKIEARKSGWAWLISKRELDRIIERRSQHRAQVVDRKKRERGDLPR